jgi:hypothetical protein
MRGEEGTSAPRRLSRSIQLPGNTDPYILPVCSDTVQADAIIHGEHVDQLTSYKHSSGISQMLRTITGVPGTAMAQGMLYTI